MAYEDAEPFEIPKPRKMFGFDWAAGFDSPFQPSASALQDAALAELGLDSTSHLVDLGSGDGRVVCAAAAKYGCRAWGIELDGALVAQSQSLAEELVRLFCIVIP
jgi:cyclopropane fatty-acyl-phospholipid synthase-like methyltransferase